MGNEIFIKNEYKIFALLVVSLFFLISTIIPSSQGADYLKEPNTILDTRITSMISNEIEIPADSDYYIKFLSSNATLSEEEIEPYSRVLSDKAKAAIAKSPNWIQLELTRQLRSLDNPDEYAELLLNSSKKYTDEIAFTIAYSPYGFVPPAKLLKENAYFLYENDKWIDYAEIVDYDHGNGNYYSTIKYNVLENDTKIQFEYPKDIYYWYVVHPKTASEDAEFLYGRFWRDYLFNHNDLGYPLIKEKISNIEYLWDGFSYSQPKNRLWTVSIENHPTAIEAIGYWVGKTVPALAVGDRPSQPNIIAHEHNGWCGELQRIAIAAQRAVLIPSVGAFNIGEDHVWREFFERGWHQNDNWWADGGGTVDIPDVYEYGWGKNMSSVYSWKGDDTIYDVTSTYIHPEDRYDIKFIVKDMYLNPVDGARITALVRGIKDTTWYKNEFLKIVENIWDKLPEIIKVKLLQLIYEKIYNRVEKIPDSTEGLTLSIFNFTNSDGECTFTLGRGRTYLFIIQQGNLKKFWLPAVNNAIRYLPEPRNKTFKIIFPNTFHQIQKHINNEIPEGECKFNISFKAESYQLQKNLRFGKVGYNPDKGEIDFFVLDEENFDKYKNGKKFQCYDYVESKEVNISFNTNNKDWFLVFRNHARRTNIILDFSIQVETNKDDFLEIVHPDTNIFDNPVFNIGDVINISGIASSDVQLTFIYPTKMIQIEEVSTEEQWFYNWNTSGYSPGQYTILAITPNLSDRILITLQDECPPNVIVKKPEEDKIIEENILNISGESSDNFGIDKVEVSIDDDEFITVFGTLNWFINYDISNFDLGSHKIFAKTTDLVGKEAITELIFYINDSGHDWGPQINSLYHFPDEPTNISNVVIYANVTSTSLFGIKKVVLFTENSSKITSKNMYAYGVDPIQDRHEEDPLFNESNKPIYGCELGQFSNDEQITYWIVAYDDVNNMKKSSEKSFTIGNFNL